jgi:hypothetical protein
MILVLLLTLGFAATSFATTANFQAWCQSGIPTFCSFNANRTPSGQTPTSCTSGSVSLYFWDFGDGGSATGGPGNSHVYPGAVNFASICLSVFCTDLTTATKCHCFSNVIGVGGCIRPGAGWTP